MPSLFHFFGELLGVGVKYCKCIFHAQSVGEDVLSFFACFVGSPPASTVYPP